MNRKTTLLLCALALLAAMAGAMAEPGDTISVGPLEVARQQIPDNEAMAFLRRMGVGWNLGNTFDAWDDNTRDPMGLEKYWCGVKTTEAMIKALKQAGFSTLRIPVSWHNHVDGELNIDGEWLERVRQVADWALDRDMTVIVNIHHDTHRDYYYPTEALYAQSERYVRRIWEQLAARFADCGDRLIFESINEPRMADTQWEWWLDENSEECRQAADCVNRLNQVFVDTVRAAGGNNATRYLMVPGYDASASSVLGDWFALPEDAADNRVIVSVHAYTPYSFALEDGGTDSFELATGAQTAEIGGFMNGLYEKYISKGIPVVIGEFGARDKKGNLQARVNFASYYTAQASARNIPCCWWDNNAFSGWGELFGLFKRADCSWPYPELVEALMKFGGELQSQ